jgi:membrane-associated phospholipid phosphatase
VLWRTDTPTNVWPSIHVYNSAVIAIAFFKSKKKKLQTLPVRLLIGIWSAGIIASTAFVKQHSLFDIISALALTVIVYIVVYTYGKVYHCKKWDAMWEAKTKGA